MYKITLYTNDGKWMEEWKVNSYDPVWNYNAIKFYIDGDGEVEDEERIVIVRGGILIVEELPNEVANH